MDFVVVGVGVGALAVLLGLIVRDGGSWWARRAAPTAPDDPRGALAFERACRAAGRVLALGGLVLLAVTAVALFAGWSDRAGAMAVMLTLALVLLGAVGWAFQYAHRHHPRPPRRPARAAQPLALAVDPPADLDPERHADDLPPRPSADDADDDPDAMAADPPAAEAPSADLDAPEDGAEPAPDDDLAAPDAPSPNDADHAIPASLSNATPLTGLDDLADPDERLNDDADDASSSEQPDGAPADAPPLLAANGAHASAPDLAQDGRGRSRNGTVSSATGAPRRPIRRQGRISVPRGPARR